MQSHAWLSTWFCGDYGVANLSWLLV